MSRLFVLLFLISSFWSCSDSDSISSSLELGDNQMGWKLQDKSYIPKSVNSSLIHKNGKDRFSVAAFNRSDGVLLLLSTPTKENLEGTYPVDKSSGNSIQLNEVDENNVATKFLTDACSDAQGKIVITAHDSSNKLISGYFEAKLCAKIPITDSTVRLLEQGQFKNISYFETSK